MNDDLAQATADKVRDEMFARDHASQGLGIQVLELTPGVATLSMTVREDMLNGHRICHGGLIAALADSAFAFACNSGNEMTVASGFSIDFCAPAHLGDVLTARCAELVRGKRTGVYDAEIVNQKGERIALFRGRSYALQGRVVVAR
ncbi:MAG TPA: hydroxyphenylacetyl-CoA thioesterase PaaI [Steroidobacteraceae bacterium]